MVRFGVMPRSMASVTCVDAQIRISASQIDAMPNFALAETSTHTSPTWYSMGAKRGFLARLKKGRSIVPHGHDNMCTGFVVLRGEFEGKHYDRIEDKGDHYLIKPTIDRLFKPGECSTISDHKDNVHWFKAVSETAFVFNIHVNGYNMDSKKASRRVYLDPEGEKGEGGLIVAKKISSTECHKKFG